MRHLILSTLVVTLLGLGAGCGDRPRTPQALTAGACPEPGVAAGTAEIFAGLKPACEGCHMNGTRAYFASLGAFQQLLVADARLVAPGDAAGSELVRLLEGQGGGAFKQMPIAGSPYAGLGLRPSMDEIKAWIAGLPAQQRGSSPDARAPRVIRLSARQIQRALYQQLGLAHEDFFTTAYEFGVPVADASLARDDLYPVQGPDMIPMPRNAASAERFLGLGGSSILQQARQDLSTPPTFAHLMTQVSQRWCRLALAKAGNLALFPGGGGLSSDPAVVKETIRRWHLHFLGEQAGAAQVASLYERVFAPLLLNGAEPAYVGLCSYFIRHPHWLYS